MVVANISTYGAMLIGRRFPDAGAHVTLSIAGNDLVATVAWSGDEKCGLMFHEQIDPATFAQVSSGTGQETGQPERPNRI